MPSASKYIIDVANIKPGGNSIKELWVGNSESKYAMHGNTCIYDKVLYELSVDNIINVEPNAQTVNITSYTSKRTHGNGASDTLGITPSSKQITANTSSANTKDTTVVVTQLTGTTATGASVTVTITQKKDYPTGITLSISPKSTIPASGGSITTALTNYTYSVKANYKSGNNNVDVTASSTISANVTGVTAASKGTSASTATVAGTIRFTASYTCNGVTKTSTVDVNIMQDKNEVVAYANPTFTLSPGNTTLPASGGSVTGSVSAIQQVRTWSSTSTDTITPTSTTAWTAQTISCESRGTITGNTLTLGTTTATVTANGKSTSKSYVVYQQANAITAYSKPTGLSLSCADIPAGGGTVTAATGGTISQTRTYTSKATDTINPTVTITWNPAQTATANSLDTTDKARTKITTLTATYSANGQSNSTSVDVYQQANGHTDSWNNPVVTITYATFSAAGGTKTPTTCSATQSGTRTWTSGSQTGITNTSFTWGDYSMTNGTGFTLSNASTGSVKAESRGTTTGATRSNNTISRTATGAGSKQGTGSGTVTQEANTVTRTWGEIIGNPTGSCPTIPASGGTVTATTTTPQTLAQKWTDTYTSGSAPTGTTNQSCTVAYVGGNTATASSRGTTTGNTKTIANLTLRATSPAATGSKIKDVTITAYQQANSETLNWLEWITLQTGSCPTIPASGGTVTATTTTPQTLVRERRHTFTSNDGNYTESVRLSCTVAYVGGNTATASSRGTTTGNTKTIANLTLRATPIDYPSMTKDVTITAYQQANVATTTWNDPVVTLNPTSLSFTSGASSQNITASATQSGVITYTSTDTASTSNSSFTWSWTKDGSWITVGSSGTNTKAISVTANSNTSDRSGSVTATALGAGSKSSSKSAPVSQAGAQSKLTPSVQLDGTFLYYKPSQLSFNSTSTPTQVVLKTESSNTWRLSKSTGDSWIYVSPTTGTGDGQFTASAQTNTSSSDRTGLITINVTFPIMEFSTDSVNVSQSGTGSTPTTESYSVQVQGGAFSNRSSSLTVWTDFNSTNLSLEGSFACGTLWDECSPATASVILNVEGEHNFTVSEVPVNGTKQITWIVDWSFWKTNGYSGGPTTGSLINLALYADNSKKQDITINYPTTSRVMDFKYSDLHGASSITLVINASQQYD